MRPVKLSELRELPAALDLMSAARILGIGRTKAYELARRDEFPCRVIRVGGSYLVPTADLLHLLGIEPQQTATPHPKMPAAG